MKPVLMNTGAFLAATAAQGAPSRFTFIAEASDGATIKEDAVSASNHAEALRMFWDGMSGAQRDACACVECLDTAAS